MMKPAFRSLVRSLLTGLAAVVLLPLGLRAQVDGNWNVDAAGNWSLGTNWSSNPAIPGGIGSTVNLTFDITAARTITIDGTGDTGSRTVGILNIGDADGSHAYTLTRNNQNVLIFDNGVPASQLNQIVGSAANTIGGAIRLDGSTLNISNNSANLLTLSAAITGGSPGRTISNVGAGAGQVTISGAVGANVGSIVQDSASSQLNLTGNNNASNFAGNVQVKQGTLRIGTANALNAANTVQVDSGATFNLDNGSSNFTIAGLTGAGSVTRTSNNNFFLAGDGNYTFDGVISTAITLNTRGTGTHILTGANTYTGATRLGGGGATLRLDFSAAGAPTDNIVNNVANSSKLFLEGGVLEIVYESGATANTQRFNGTEFSFNNSTSFAGASAFRVDQNGNTNVASGVTLGVLTRTGRATVDFTLPTSGFITTTSTGSFLGTNRVLAVGNVAFATSDATDWVTNQVGGILGTTAGLYGTDFTVAGSDIDVTADVSPSVFTVNTLRFNTADKTLTLDASGPSTVTTGGILVTANGTGSVIASGGAGAGLRAGTLGKELVVHNYGDLEIAAPIVDNAGASALTVTGTGVTTLSAVNTYTSFTTINGGTLRLAPGGSIESTSNLLVRQAGAAGTPTFDLNGISQTLAAVDNHGIITNGAAGKSTLTIEGGALTGSASGSFTGNLDLVINNGNTAATYNGALNNAGSITNSGAGTGAVTLGGAIGSNVTSITQDSATSSLTLNATGGNPDFSGPIYVNSGSLSGAVGALGTGTIYLGDTSGSANATVGVAGQTNALVVRAGSTGELRISMSNTSGSASFTGPITLNRDLTYLQTSVTGGNHAWNSPVDGTGNLIFSQAATTGDFNTFNVGGPLNQIGDIISIGAGTTLTRLGSNLGFGINTIVQNSTTSALELTGNNAAFGGNVEVQAGVLQASGANAFNASNTVQVDAGATFRQNVNTLTIAGLNGSGSVTKTNGGPRTLTLGGSGEYDFSGVISNADSTFNLIKVGTGTQTLRGANTYNGAGVATRVADGTLRLAVSTGGDIGSINSASILTMHGGSFVYDGTGSTATNDNSQSLASLTISKGSNTVASIKDTAASSTLTFGALNARATGATANFVVADGVNGTDNRIVLTGVSDGFMDRAYFFNGDNFAYYDAGGFVRGVDWGVDAGSTTAAGGTSLATTAYAQTTGDVTAQASSTFTALNLVNETAGARAFTLAGTLTTNAILVSGNGGGVTTISDPGDVGGLRAASGQELVIRTDQAGDILHITAQILPSATNALVKDGAGTLVLASQFFDNDYTGQTYVNGGVLEIGSNGQLGRQSTAAQLNLNNGTLRATSTFGLYNVNPGTNNRAVRINNTGTFDVTEGNTLTVAGTITDGWTSTTTADFKGTLVKTGEGALELRGANTYNGDTLVNAGTLILASTSTLPNTPLIRVAEGATIDVSALGSGFTLTSGKRLENAGTFAGDLTVDAGALYAPGGSGPGNALHDGDMTLNTGSFFQWELTANTTGGAGTNYDRITFLDDESELTIQSGATAYLIFDGTGSTVNWNDNFWLSDHSWLVFSGANSLDVTAGVFGTTAVGYDMNGQHFSATGGAFSFVTVGNDIYLNFTAIPEPSTGVLLGLGLGACWFSRRGRRKR